TAEIKPLRGLISRRRRIQKPVFSSYLLLSIILRRISHETAGRLRPPAEAGRQQQSRCQDVLSQLKSNRSAV
ncbi:MAG: hypothetical protein ACLTTY_05500, partial [Oscillospiraceae bacterium]